MSVKKDPSGRRSVQVEVEVPGTPEEVWEAIATGPGVSSWFVPTEIREDGSIVSRFGPGMEAVATQTAWDPPHRFAGEGDLGPGAPKVATEWIVEARSGGTCVVRVVHSLFASTDDWDDQLEGIEAGWPTWFRVLRLYLAHFRGMPCSTFRPMGVAPGPESAAWDKLTNAFGLAGIAANGRWSAADGTPSTEGVLEWIGEGKQPHDHCAGIRLDAPTPGIALLTAHTIAGRVYLGISFYLYGDRAAEAATRDEPLWHAWMSTLFPAIDSGGDAA